MAKKAFCQHKSTEMISGVANYFAAPCTLLDIPRPLRPFWPQSSPLFRPPDFCSYSFYWCLCEELFKWFAHLQRTTPTPWKQRIWPTKLSQDLLSSSSTAKAQQPQMKF